MATTFVDVVASWATYADADPVPASGQVTVHAVSGTGGNPIAVLDPSGDVIYAKGGRRRKLDDTGSVTFRLPASDDPGLQPTGYVYRFQAVVGGDLEVHEVEVLASNAPTVQLADIAPAQAVESSDTFVLQSVFDDHSARHEGGADAISPAGIGAAAADELGYRASNFYTPGYLGVAQGPSAVLDRMFLTPVWVGDHAINGLLFRVLGTADPPGTFDAVVYAPDGPHGEPATRLAVTSITWPTSPANVIVAVGPVDPATQTVWCGGVPHGVSRPLDVFTNNGRTLGSTTLNGDANALQYDAVGTPPVNLGQFNGAGRGYAFRWRPT